MTGALSGAIQTHGQQAQHDHQCETCGPGGEWSYILLGSLNIQLKTQQVGNAVRSRSKEEIQAREKEYWI